MTRTRLAAGMTAVGVAAVVLLVTAWERAHRPSDDSRGIGARTRVEMSPMPLPTSTPPWVGSVLAAVVPEGDGRAVALYPVGVDAPPRRLAGGFDEIEGLAWSPDGSALAFAGRRDANWDIFRIDRDGGEPGRLTDHPAHDTWPAWSPDGHHVSFASHRDGNLDVYRVSAGGWLPDRPERLTAGGAPSIEPAWSPDGAWIAYAAWHEGAYRLEALPAELVSVAASDDSGVDTGTGGADAGEPRVLAVGDGGQDLRAPKWTRDGRTLGYLEWRHGPGRLVVRDLAADAAAGEGDGAGPAGGSYVAVASEVRDFDWFPKGDEAILLVDERGSRQLEVWDRAGHGRRVVGALPTGTGDIAWTEGPMPAGLETMAAGAGAGGGTGPAADGSGGASTPVGFASLADVRVPGARIHADLAENYAAMRAEVRAAVGSDFLGTLSDLWRPLGFTGSSFFSWHKLGRAFDTQMELRGPGGRRDMVLVRDDARGRTRWRMYLRAAAQDGTVGRPLVEPGWTFAAGSGDPELAREGGRRGAAVPGGYWYDFTALAERHGWQRIPSITRGDLDWRRNWTGIDYWHYERRDGLRWFDAARQVYEDDLLASELRVERLRERGVSLGRLTWLGFPRGWVGGG